MQTYIVELTNKKAFKLLKELEDLHLIKLVKSKTLKPDEHFGEQFANKLSANLASKLHKHTAALRNEWERNF